MLNSDYANVNRQSGKRRLAAAACLFVSTMLGGCAALTNPVANGVPVNRLSPELLREPREDARTIPLTLLRQDQPEVFLVGPGDILGVWISEVLGGKDQQPPVHHQEGGRLPPAIGFPIPVREDGRIVLPQIEPLDVSARSLKQVEERIRTEYVRRRILEPQNLRIIVTLIRPRSYHITVIRQDSGGLTVGGGGVIGSSKRGTGYAVDLPAYENDVLNALARTGGLPGLDAANEIIIQRDSKGGLGRSRLATMPGMFLDGSISPPGGGSKLAPWKTPAGDPAGPTGPGGPNGTHFVHAIQGLTPDSYPSLISTHGEEVIRIPMRLRPGEPIPFKPKDVVLNSGDIVFIESRDTELFYTGGLLPIGEHVLPRDYDLDVVEALARVGGPLVNGGFNSGNQFASTVVSGGLGGPSPSLLTVLRKTKSGVQVPIRVDLNRALRDPRERILLQPGDVLLLQETPGEAFVRYATSVFNFSSAFSVFSRGDASGAASVGLP